ncbi:MAG: TatD family hydrolase [Planctomycetota bacterium]|nr:TatD family hydrolase [Planctomycetota bacterium]
MPAEAIDSHAHLYFDRFDDDRHEVIERAKDAGFVAIINIAVDEQTSSQVIELAQQNPGFCHAVIGVHPTHSGMSADDLKTTLAAIEKLCDEHSKQVVGIGEIGLDYYWKDVSPEDQERAFIAQLEIARRRNLPVVIHCREAWQDTLDVIEQHGDGVTGVFHCFSGTVEQAQRALGLGWYLSFAGNLTYPKAQDLRDAAAIVPLDRLLLETDSPFLAPQPKRGKRNEPVHSLHTADELARVHGTDRKTVLAATTSNSRTLFRLKE